MKIIASARKYQVILFLLSNNLRNQTMPFTCIDSLAISPIIGVHWEIEDHVFVFHPFFQPMQLKLHERLRRDTVNLICILRLYSDQKKLPECLFFQVHWLASRRSLVHQSNCQVHFLISAMPKSHSIIWPLSYWNSFCSLPSNKDQ